MTPCVKFEGYLNRDGYGVKRVGDKTFLAHRLAYSEAKGLIPEGNVVRHMCHNPACVNPEHLEVGTQFDNVHDMIQAGRKAVAKGSEHPLARLTPEQVIAIFQAKGKTQKRLAEEFGVSRSHISNIRGGRLWADLTSTLERT